MVRKSLTSIRTSRGFSIPEVLLSLLVLSIGIMTIVSILSKSLVYSYDTRDTIVATELAQEGVELVRNVRDNDFASGGDGFDNPTVFDNAQKHCRIDWNDPDDALDCNANQGAASRYYLQYSGGLYAHVNVTIERYSRYVYIDYTNNAQGERALVRSFVYWGSFMPPNTGDSANCTPANKCVFTETFLTSWK